MRRTFLRPACFALLTLTLIAGFAMPVWAHAVLVESKPIANSTINGPDIPIRLRFNVRIDGMRSKLTLIASDGRQVGLPSTAQPQPDMLSTDASGLKPGAYKLRWQVLASDGHISRGEVDFTVK